MRAAEPQSPPPAPHAADRGHDTLRELFTSAVVLPPPDRSAFLDHACAGDLTLRQELDALLACHDPDGGFMEQGAVSDCGLISPTPEEGLPPGSRLGPYVIIRTIGSGGMGIVYEAEQQSPRRRVALKVMRPGFVSGAMVRRFRHEAAALAKLQHPGIAQIFEAARDLSGGGGTPYLAMELVVGRPLNVHAAESTLPSTPPASDRLGLILQVCEAVTHAHQRGVIHRDLKPGNILVDESGRVKVLDFGIARLTEHDPQTSLATSSGQVLGTLAYMSPEQASGDPGRADVRSDVYSIGAILFELLTGHAPHELSRCSIAEAVRRINDVPARSLASVDRVFRGELATITDRALHRDPARRYQSAEALAEDIRRYLDGQPILAKADSTLYVIRKQLQRNKGPVAVAVLAILALISFSVYASFQARRSATLADQEAHARQLADQARDRARDSQRLAEQLRARADASAARLADQLRVTNVSHARWLLQTGSFADAERLLWREHLQNPDSAMTLTALHDLCAAAGVFRPIASVNARSRGLGLHPDRRTLAFDDLDGFICLQDLYTGTVHARLCAGGIAPNCVFDASGQRLAVRDAEGLTTFFDVTNLARPIQLWQTTPPAKAEVNGMAIDPFTRWVAVCGPGGINLLDAATGALLREFNEGDFASVIWQSVAFDPSGDRLAFGGRDGRLYVADLRATDDRTLRRIRVSGDVIHVLFSHDGERLFVGVGASDEAILVVDPATRRQLARVPTRNGTVRHLSLNRDGSLLLSTGWFRSEFWDTAALERRAPNVNPLTTFTPHAELDSMMLATVSAAPDRSRHTHTPAPLPPPPTLPKVPVGGFRGYIIEDAQGRPSAVLGGGSSEASIRLWLADRSPRIADLRHHTRLANRLTTSSDGSRLLSSAADGSACLWNTRTWKPIRRIADADCVPAVSTISPDGSLIALATADGRVRVEEAETCRIVAQFSDFTRGARDLIFTRDQRHLIGVTRGGATRVWDLAPEGSPRRPTDFLGIPNRELFRLASSPDGRWVAAASRNNRLSICETATWTRQIALPIEPLASWCLDFSPDSTRVVMGAWGGDVEIWDLASEKRILRLDAHRQVLRQVRWSPDASIIASASGDGMVKLWHARTGVLLSTIGNPDLDGRTDSDFPCELTFINNSKQLAIGFEDGHIEVWDLGRFDEWIAMSAEHFLRTLGPALGTAVDHDRVRSWAASLAEQAHTRRRE